MEDKNAEYQILFLQPECQVLKMANIFLKIMLFVLIIFNILIISKIAFAEGFKTIRGDVYQKQDGTFAKDEWLSIDSDNDGLYEWYFFNSFGLKVINMNVKGYDLDEKGRWVKDGVVQYDTTKMQLNNQVNNNTTVNTNMTITQYNNSQSSNISTTNQNTSNYIISKNANINKDTEININDNVISGGQNSSVETKKNLYSNITQKQGTTLYDTKKVNSTGWINVIGMNGNNSYIKSNSGNYNCLSMEVCIDKPTDNTIYDLSIYVNNQLLETYDDFDDEPQQIEVFFDTNSNIMIVYNASSEDDKYLSNDNKTLYIRNGRFKNKKEKE